MDFVLEDLWLQMCHARAFLELDTYSNHIYRLGNTEIRVLTRAGYIYIYILK
jgi:hypothetical protein